MAASHNYLSKRCVQRALPSLYGVTGRSPQACPKRNSASSTRKGRQEPADGCCHQWPLGGAAMATAAGPSAQTFELLLQLLHFTGEELVALTRVWRCQTAQLLSPWPLRVQSQRETKPARCL